MDSICKLDIKKLAEMKNGRTLVFLYIILDYAIAYILKAAD